MWMYGIELQVPYVKGGGSGGRRLRVGEEIEVAGDTANSGLRVRGKSFTTSKSDGTSIAYRKYESFASCDAIIS